MLALQLTPTTVFVRAQNLLCSDSWIRRPGRKERMNSLVVFLSHKNWKREAWFSFTMKQLVCKNYHKNVSPHVSLVDNDLNCTKRAIPRDRALHAAFLAVRVGGGWGSQHTQYSSVGKHFFQQHTQ